MRFIILAPILCLLAIVAAYPIQQVRSVGPLTFLRAKEPAGDLIPRNVMRKIYERLKPSPSLPVNWHYYPSVTIGTPGLHQAKVAATRQMMDFIRGAPGRPEVDWTSVSISWAPSRFLVDNWQQLMFITLSVWILIREQARGPVWESAFLSIWVSMAKSFLGLRVAQTFKISTMCPKGSPFFTAPPKPRRKMVM